MKTLAIILVTLCAATAAYAQADIQEEFPVTKGELLDVKLKAGGAIEIEGWDKEIASVEVRFHDCDPDDFAFDISKSRSGVEIRSKYRNRAHQSNITVRVNVPREFDLKLKSAGGSITIDGIDGHISGSTGGGKLKLSNLTGEIDLSSGGGGIKLTDSKLDGEVTTGGGPVLVENVEGDIDARSGGGNVVYRNVKTPKRHYPADLVHIRSAGGAVRVDDAPAGADIRTGGGDIELGSAAVFVQASTGGGDIIVDAIDGWVELSTGAGDIEVRMVGDPAKGRRDVEIRTGTGDVMLTVPPGLSMDIDIELSYTRGSRRQYEIESDFDLEEETTTEWDYDHGSPRKFIYGTGKTGDGKHKIHIRTVNGNVILRAGRKGSRI